jgi:hypothetical protein
MAHFIGRTVSIEWLDRRKRRFFDGEIVDYDARCDRHQVRFHQDGELIWYSLSDCEREGILRWPSPPLPSAATDGDENPWQTSGHEWLDAGVRRIFDGEGTNGKVVKWAPANGKDPAMWHIEHEDGDEEDLEEEEVREAMICFLDHTGTGTLANRPRPKRAAAEASASRWVANLQEYNGAILSSADEDEDGEPVAPRRGRRKAAGTPRPRARAGEDSGEDCDDDDDGEWGASSDDDDDDEAYEEEDDDDDEKEARAYRQAECVPPEDTSPEAAVDAAVAARRDLSEVGEALWGEALRAAIEAHGASLERRGRAARASRSGGGEGQPREQVTAYYLAEAAAAAVLKRAHPPKKSTKRMRRAAEVHDAQVAGDEHDLAGIEKERRRNMARNHEVLVSLGLA